MTASHAIRGQRRASLCAPPSSVPGARNFQSLEIAATHISKHWKLSRRRDFRAGPRSGQAIIESCIVVILMSLMLFGLIEIGRLFMGREAMNYAASVGARARAVGFNDFMIFKTMRVASIPIAGKMLMPSVTLTDPNSGRWSGSKPGSLWDFAVTANPVSQQYDQIEQSRIPLYLGAQTWGELQPILNYEDWDKQAMITGDNGDEAVVASIREDVPLKFAFHRAFWGADYVQESGNASMDGHYLLYLDPSVSTAP